MKRDVAADLGRRLQELVGEVIEQQMKIAGHVLEPHELGVMLIEAAVSVGLTAAASVAASAEPGRTEHLYDVAIAAIVAGLQGDRDRSLAAVRERLASEAAE